MVTEKNHIIRMSIKNGKLPTYSYSGIDANASNSEIYDLAQKLMRLQPSLEADETQTISKYVETIIAYES